MFPPAKASKHAGGRPSHYTKETEDQICALAVEMLGKGKTLVQLSKKIGVDYSTIHRWKGMHEKFRHAMNFGDAQADEMVVNALFKRATGTATTKETKFFQSDGIVTDERTVTKESLPDTGAAKHWLKHRQSTREQWKDIQTVENTTKIDISAAISHAIHATQLQDDGAITPVGSSNTLESRIIDQEPDNFLPFPGESSKVAPTRFPDILPDSSQIVSGSATDPAPAPSAPPKSGGE